MIKRLYAGLLAASAVAVLLVSGVSPAAATDREPQAVAPVANAVAVAEPSTSPAVERTWVGHVGLELCSSGYFCAFVQSNDPAKRFTGWWRFKFYTCTTYSLSNWYDYTDGAWSEVLDYQTGGVATAILGASGNTLQTVRPNTGAIQPILEHQGGWNSVYKIRTC
ncbi:hypothetical protein [Kribbella sp. NPDC051620]|uniref:hypothetical protein n=1 Tax=Kribbella sp. NPDC051620 TaxID=3364120 RepID=UPI0037B48349